MRSGLMWSVLPSIVILGLVAVFAVQITCRRSSPADAGRERAAASAVLGLTTAIQSVHFAEEWATGFNVRFPALLGLDPMPLPFFVSFNLAWLAVWIASIPAIRLGRKLAFFAAWFLALAGILNGVAHPILAIVSDGYFPGLITSPLIGLAGVLLWKRLHEATSGPTRAL